MIKKILIANRGEIAIRIIRACKEMDIATVAVYSEADVSALHVRMADEAICIGKAVVSESYLNIPAIILAAKTTNADAIHPGYGFLSENAKFARATTDSGLIFIGPSADVIAVMGSKTSARTLMQKANIPVVPGYQGEDQSIERLSKEALLIGYPILVKAAAGGGGKGMKIVTCEDDLLHSVDSAKREALKAFGDSTVFLERYIVKPRHIEFQIFADNHGNVVHLFERECSIQRRHQKVLEETPSLALTSSLREKMGEVAISAAKAIGYVNAGTVEFILDTDGSFYFLEINTRLQVEHPVTELTTGIDLVKAQINIANGEVFNYRNFNYHYDHYNSAYNIIEQRGHAIEVRIYAENTSEGFLPSTGVITVLHEPCGPGIRLDSSLFAGMEVPIHYDPMLSKLIAFAETRELAILKLKQALLEYVIIGVSTNISFLLEVLNQPAFSEGKTFTSFISEYLPQFLTKNSITDDIVPDNVWLAAAMSSYFDKILEDKNAKNFAEDSDIFSPWDKLGNFRL